MKSRKLMFHGLVKALPREFMELTDIEGKVGVIDQDVDTGPPFLDGCQHCLHLIFSRHVRLKDHALAATRFNFLEDFLRRFSVLVVVDDDGGAGLRQPIRCSRAYTAAPPGD